MSKYLDLYLGHWLLRDNFLQLGRPHISFMLGRIFEFEFYNKLQKCFWNSHWWNMGLQVYSQFSKITQIIFLLLFSWFCLNFLRFIVKKCFEKRLGILFPKLFWPSMRKNCSSEREQLLIFEGECWEVANPLRSLEKFIQTVKGQKNLGNIMLFYLIPGVFSDLMN